MRSFPALFLALILAGCSPIPQFISRSFQRMAIVPEHVADKLDGPLFADVGLSVLWVGHACLVIQVRDKVFVTDPSFTKTIGMVAKRSVEPGLDPTTLDRVDYTLISHLHFDHFSFGSIDKLPKGGMLLIPSGGLEYTPDFGFRDTRDLQPWEMVEENGVKVTAVPVQHFGGRYGFDIAWMQDRGYTGYVIEYDGTTVFVGGDMGYHPTLYKEIGRRFSIDLALIPIAPIEPRDFMARVHVDPAEAVQAFDDLRARVMVPMHHRTFFQGLEPSMTYAQELLEEIIKARQLQDRILILAVGERKVLATTPPAGGRTLP